MTDSNTLPQDGIGLVEQRIKDLGERLQVFTEERNQATASDLREELAKAVSGMEASIVALREERKRAEGQIISGADLFDVAAPHREGFSFARAAKAMGMAAKAPGSNVWGQKEFGYERDYFAEVRSRIEAGVIKTHTGASDAAGAFLIDTMLMSTIVEKLRAISVAYRAGVRRVDGLVSDVTWIRNLGGVSGVWFDSETEASITESESTFVNIPSSPNTLGAFSKASWKMLNQPVTAIEEFIRNEFATVLALSEDLAILAGTGASGQPAGLTHSGSGIDTNDLDDYNAGSGGADAAFGIGDTSPAAGLTENAHAYFRRFLQKARSNNAYGLPGARPAFVLETEIAEDIETVVQPDTGMPAFLTPGQGLVEDVMRTPVLVSNQLAGGASDRTGIYGDWNQVIVPHWGMSEFRAFEAGDDFQKARVSFRLITAMDVAIMQPLAFVKTENYSDT